jgi:hypothetical protein
MENKKSSIFTKIVLYVLVFLIGGAIACASTVYVYSSKTFAIEVFDEDNNYLSTITERWRSCQIKNNSIVAIKSDNSTEEIGFGEGSVIIRPIE